jgi:hypothetical protein
MKRFVLIVLLSLGCFATTAVALAGGSGRTTPKTVNLAATMTSLRLAVDAKPKGPSPGDLGYVAGTLFRNAKPVGRYTGTCAQFAGGNQQCTFVLGLPEGQIVITAGYGQSMNTGNVAHEAIVGGTGAYEGARGQGDDRELSNTKLAFQLHLLP